MLSDERQSRGAVSLFGEDGVGFECTGDECVVACDHPEGFYRVIGVFSARGSRITVDSISATRFR